MKRLGANYGRLFSLNNELFHHAFLKMALPTEVAGLLEYLEDPNPIN